MRKQKQKQVPYIHNDYIGTRTRFEWSLYIQDKWDTDFLTAQDEFDAQLKDGRFTKIESL